MMGAVHKADADIACLILKRAKECVETKDTRRLPDETRDRLAKACRGYLESLGEVTTKK